MPIVWPTNFQAVHFSVGDDFNAASIEGLAMRHRRSWFFALQVLLTVAFVVLPVLNAYAQDHLVPELGSINDHGLDHTRSLREALLGKDVNFDPYRARVFVLPSFKYVWVVTLHCDEGEEPAYFIDYATFKPDQPQVQIKDAAVQKVKCPIDRKTGEALERVWLRMLREVRYPERFELRADGATYHFSRFVLHGDPRAPAGSESGQTWSPQPASLTGRLVALGEGMRDLALAREADRGRLAEAIYMRATALQRDLERESRPNPLPKNGARVDP